MQLCEWITVPYSTLRRWRTRWRRGEPMVRRPGPSKIGPLPVAELRSRVAELGHAVKRSRGFGALYEAFQHVISRRDLAEFVADEREEQYKERRAALHHLTWHAPGLAWAIDATLLRTSPSDPGMVAVLARDLASHYHFEPLVLPTESAHQNTLWLRDLIRRHPPPLLVKRDNGSPFNETVFDQLLADENILPLNSPVCRPQYNGAIEHGIGSFKRQLLDAVDPAQPVPAKERLLPLARSVVHLHNTRPRRSLKGLTPAQAYHHADPFRRTRKERHAIFESISEQTFEILQSDREKSGRHDFASAWRQSVVIWLRRQSLITVSQNQKLLPNFIQEVRS